MTTLKIWIQASRPRTLAASICPVMIGSTVALSWGTFDVVIFLLTLFSALAIQITTNLANDYFDFKKGVDTAARIGPQRVMQAGLVRPKTMERAILFTMSLAALSGLFLIHRGGAVIGLLGAVSLLLAILYSGGPFPLASLGLGDLFVFLFFGPIATLGTFYLQAQQFSYDALLVGVGPGALSLAILLLNNLRDMNEDRAAGKNTLCVRFGAACGKAMYTISLALPLFLPYLWIESRPFLFLASLSAAFVLPLIKTVLKNGDLSLLSAPFQRTAKLLLLYTLLFCIGWML